MNCLGVGLSPEVEQLLTQYAPEIVLSRMAFDLNVIAESTPAAPLLVVCGPPPAGTSMVEAAQLLRMQYQDVPLYLVVPGGAPFDRRALIKNGMNEVFFLPLDQDILGRALVELVTTIHKRGKIYRPVKLLDLQPDTVLDFDTFIYLPANNKHIKFSASGEEMEKTRLERLAKHNMSSVFVEPSSLPKFYAYSAKILRSMGKDVQMSETERAQRLHSASRDLVSGLFSDDISGTDDRKRILEDCRQIVKGYVAAGGGAGLFNRIAALTRGTSDTYSHASNVSTYAALFAMGLGMGSVDEIALAGLLHDIGLAKVPHELQNKPIEKMSALEANAYKHHPEEAISMIRERRMVVPELVHKIILQHHEKFNGSGYPKGLRGDRICLEAQVLAFADRFDEMTAVTPGMNHLSAAQAAQELERLVTSDPSKAFIDPALLKRLLALFPAVEPEARSA